MLSSHVQIYSGHHYKMLILMTRIELHMAEQHFVFKIELLVWVGLIRLALNPQESHISTVEYCNRHVTFRFPIMHIIMSTIR